MTYQALAAYSRLSSNPDGTLTSVDDQERMQQAHAQANGNSIAEYFSDDDLSAWDESVYRPGWEAYLEALASGRFDGAMSYHFDRLARNGTDSERLLKVTTQNGLPLITPQQVLDLGANADARMVFRIMAAVVINQSDSTSRRGRDHRDVAREAGRMRYVMGGSPPLGYQLQGEGRQAIWVVEPTAAGLLAEVAPQVIQGQALTAIWEALEGRWTAEPGSWVHDSRGQRVSLKQLRAALQRPITYGLMTERRPMVRNRKGRLVPSSKPGAIAGPTGEPSPLPPQLYWEVRAVFASRERGQAIDPDQYPLGPILRCGVCLNQLTGQPMYDRRKIGGQWQVIRTTPSYSCKNPHPKLVGRDGLPITRACRGVSISADQLHRKVRDSLEGWAAGSDWYAASQADTAALTARQDELEAEAARWRKRLGNLALDLADDAEYDQLRAVVKARLAAVQDEQAQLAAEVSTPLPRQLDWDAMTAAEKRAMIQRAFGPTITVAPGNGGARALTVDDRVQLVPSHLAA